MPTDLILETEGLTKEFRGFLAVKDVSLDRKSTRLNSSHSSISYAVFCLKKKIANPFPKRLLGPVSFCSACCGIRDLPRLALSHDSRRFRALLPLFCSQTLRVVPQPAQER